MKHIRMSDLPAQLSSLQPELHQELVQFLTSGQFIGGAPNKKFEGAFAELVGASSCVGVGNGTDALELAFQALDLAPGSEVIVPANSFAATAEAVVRSGLTPRFCDVDETYTLSLTSMERLASDRVSAIAAVHLYGQPARMGALLELARSWGVPVVEDCAQAHLARVGERHVGSIGVFGCFSFFPGKNLGAIGDAGAIVTSDAGLGGRVRQLANHGRTDKQNHLVVGRNSRLDSLQALVLGMKLHRLEEWTTLRQKNARLYADLFEDVHAVTLPASIPGTDPVFHQFVVRIDQRDDLRQFLLSKGVETGVHYPIALPDQPAFRPWAEPGSTPNACRWAQEIVSLPVGEHLTSEDICFVADCVREFASSLLQRP